MNRPPTIQVMLVDDHNVVRSGLATFLRAYEDLELVGEAKNGLEAVQLCRQTRPDVILMDLLMPEMDGIAATRAILADSPEMKIIAMTSFEQEDLVQGVLAAGAISYLLKNVSGDELAEAIRSAHAGKPTLAPEAVQALIQPPVEEAPAGYDLTVREREVLALLAKGLSNNDIAERLNVSHATAKAHVSNILSKLGVSSRGEAIALALENKLVGG